MGDLLALIARSHSTVQTAWQIDSAVRTQLCIVPTNGHGTLSTDEHTQPAEYLKIKPSSAQRCMAQRRRVPYAMNNLHVERRERRREDTRKSMARTGTPRRKKNANKLGSLCIGITKWYND